MCQGEARKPLCIVYYMCIASLYLWHAMMPLFRNNITWYVILYLSHMGWLGSWYVGFLHAYIMIMNNCSIQVEKPWTVLESDLNWLQVSLHVILLLFSCMHIAWCTCLTIQDSFSCVLSWIFLFICMWGCNSSGFWYSSILYFSHWYYLLTAGDWRWWTDGSTHATDGTATSGRDWLYNELACGVVVLCCVVLFCCLLALVKNGI